MRIMRGLAVVLLIAVVALVAGWWHLRTAPAEDVEQTLLSLGSPLPGATPSGVTRSTPSCDNAPRCVSASRTWTTNRTITFSEFAGRIQRWASGRGLDTGPVEWDCGPGFGPFGGAAPGGACQLGLLAHDSRTPVFLWVTFHDRHVVAAAFTRSQASGAQTNVVADPLDRLGPSQLASIGLQVVTTG